MQELSTFKQEKKEQSTQTQFCIILLWFRGDCDLGERGGIRNEVIYKVCRNNCMSFDCWSKRVGLWVEVVGSTRYSSGIGKGVNGKETCEWRRWKAWV